MTANDTLLTAFAIARKERGIKANPVSDMYAKGLHHVVGLVTEYMVGQASAWQLRIEGGIVFYAPDGGEGTRTSISFRPLANGIELTKKGKAIGRMTINPKALLGKHPLAQQFLNQMFQAVLTELKIE